MSLSPTAASPASSSPQSPSPHSRSNSSSPWPPLLTVTSVPIGPAIFTGTLRPHKAVRPQVKRLIATGATPEAPRQALASTAKAAVRVAERIVLPAGLSRSITASPAPDDASQAAGGGASSVELHDISSAYADLGLQERHTPARFAYPEVCEESVAFEVIDEGDFSDLD